MLDDLANAHAMGAYTMLNTQSNYLLAEGSHVWQSRIFNENYLQLYFLHSFIALANSHDPYTGNFFERQAHGYGNFKEQW